MIERVRVFEELFDPNNPASLDDIIANTRIPSPSQRSLNEVIETLSKEEFDIHARRAIMAFDPTLTEAQVTGYLQLFYETLTPIKITA